MEILVLGGTRFLSHAIAAGALARGHAVTCAARGESGPVPEGAKLVAVDRDHPDGLAPLTGSEFDAVVDVARLSLPWVRNAVEALADRVAHWTYVSTGSVYAHPEVCGQDVTAPVLPPVTEPTDREEDYGGVKVASEDQVRAALGDRAFVVRSGLLSGPGDRSDRFGYWPARFSLGGRVAVVDNADQPIQHLDVRDLAEWVVSAAERGLTGTYDAVGRSVRLGALLEEVAELTAAPGTELVPFSEQALIEEGVQPYMGPNSLPLWLPASHLDMGAHDGSRSFEAGLRTRPLADTVLASLDHERALGLDRERRAGLSGETEASLLSR